jgi:accessory gene regulator protein AgrB
MKKDLSKLGEERIRLEMEKDKMGLNWIVVGLFTVLIALMIKLHPLNIPKTISLLLSFFGTLILFYFTLLKPTQNKLEKYADELDRRKTP